MAHDKERQNLKSLKLINRKGYRYEVSTLARGKEARGKRQEGREARGERREARGERREARGERREARGERREARGHPGIKKK